MQSYRAHSLFQPSNLVASVSSTIDDTGVCIDHLYGSIMSFPHTVVARTVSVLGLDFVMIDALHTCVHLLFSINYFMHNFILLPFIGGISVTCMYHFLSYPKKNSDISF